MSCALFVAKNLSSRKVRAQTMQEVAVQMLRRCFEGGLHLRWIPWSARPALVLGADTATHAILVIE